VRSQKPLFITTAVIEVGAGLALVGVPGVAIWLLLGVRESSLEALIVGRIGGAGLLALGVACWLARDDRGSSPQHSLSWGMLVYNVGACAILAYVGSMLRTVGVALWPGVIVHAVMATWCAMNMRRLPPNN
jgi:hypothetical protein